MGVYSILLSSSLYPTVLPGSPSTLLTIEQLSCSMTMGLLKQCMLCSEGSILGLKASILQVAMTDGLVSYLPR